MTGATIMQISRYLLIRVLRQLLCFKESEIMKSPFRNLLHCQNIIAITVRPKVEITLTLSLFIIFLSVNFGRKLRFRPFLQRLNVKALQC